MCVHLPWGHWVRLGRGRLLVDTHTPFAFHAPRALSLAMSRRPYCSQRQHATCLGRTWPAEGRELPARARGGPQTS